MAASFALRTNYFNEQKSSYLCVWSVVTVRKETAVSWASGSTSWTPQSGELIQITGQNFHLKDILGIQVYLTLQMISVWAAGGLHLHNLTKKKRGLFHEIKTVQISLRRLSLFVLWYWEWAPSFLCHHEWVKFLNRHLLIISWQKVELGLKSLNNVLLKPNEMDGWTMEGWNLIVLKDRTRHITCSLPLTGAVFCITLKLTDDLKEILCFFLNVTVVYNTYRRAWAERVIDDSPLFMTVMWWGSKPSVHLHLDLPQTTPISGSRHPFA